jgi:hypothetical protein
MSLALLRRCMIWSDFEREKHWQYLLETVKVLPLW